MPSYAGLAGLVGLARTEAAHIVIFDGRVLALKVYSTLPGSKSKKKRGRYVTVIIKYFLYDWLGFSKDVCGSSDRFIV